MAHIGLNGLHFLNAPDSNAEDVKFWKECLPLKPRWASSFLRQPGSVILVPYGKWLKHLYYEVFSTDSILSVRRKG
jgi:hypothetical protein